MWLFVRKSIKNHLIFLQLFARSQLATLMDCHIANGTSKQFYKIEYLSENERLEIVCLHYLKTFILSYCMYLLQRLLSKYDFELLEMGGS